MTGFVMISVPFLGPFLTHPNLSQMVSRLVFLFTGTLFSFLSVYAANSYYGFLSDRDNQRFKNVLFESAGTYRLITAATLILSLFFLAAVDWRLPFYSIFNFLLWVFYSRPRGAKGRPILGTLIHFISHISQFQIWVIAVSQVSLRSVELSVYFALLFASGHLIHELKDYEADSAFGIHTNAVFFGPQKVFSFYRLLVAGTFLYLMSLGLFHVFTFGMILPFLAASIFHLWMSWNWDVEELKERPTIEEFQRIYRWNYFVAGLVIFTTTVWF